MKKKLLSIIGISAALSAASVSAQSVLFSEDWSNGMTDWKVIAGVGSYEIRNHPSESGKQIMAGVRQPDQNVLGYIAVDGGVDISEVDFLQGVSMDFTFKRVTGTTQYTRFGFGNGVGSNETSTSYYLDFAGTAVTLAKIGFDSGNKESVTYVNAGSVNPLNDFVTYSLQMIQVDTGLKVQVVYDGAVILDWIDTNPITFDDVLFPYIGIRFAVNDPVGDNSYISDITLTQIPEASHMAIVFGGLALLGLIVRRRLR